MQVVAGGVTMGLWMYDRRGGVWEDVTLETVDLWIQVHDLKEFAWKTLDI